MRQKKLERGGRGASAGPWQEVSHTARSNEPYETFNSIQFICIAHFHKLLICLRGWTGVIDVMCTEGQI